jgi:8-oxo-dGTP diphosphatase
MKYVVGFCFSEDLQRVALIRKTKPAWQKGRLNGIGGKIEATDSSSARAMEREFLEEAGSLMIAPDWKFFAHMYGPEWSVEFFYSVETDLSTGNTLEDLESLTEEEVTIVNVRDIPSLDTISNLAWLVPLAIQKIRYPEENISLTSPEELERRLQAAEYERRWWKDNSGTSFGD